MQFTSMCLKIRKNDKFIAQNRFNLETFALDLYDMHEDPEKISLIII